MNMNRISLAAALAAGALLGGTLLAPSTASAQIQQLPETSRGEAQVNSNNRSLEAAGQNRAAAQQNQFETNSLRNTLTTQSVTTPPPVVTAPPIAGPRR